MQTFTVITLKKLVSNIKYIYITFLLLFSASSFSQSVPLTLKVVPEVNCDIILYDENDNLVRTVLNTTVFEGEYPVGKYKVYFKKVLPEIPFDIFEDVIQIELVKNNFYNLKYNLKRKVAVRTIQITSNESNIKFSLTNNNEQMLYEGDGLKEIKLLNKIYNIEWFDGNKYNSEKVDLTNNKRATVYLPVSLPLNLQEEKYVTLETRDYFLTRKQFISNNYYALNEKTQIDSSTVSVYNATLFLGIFAGLGYLIGNLELPEEDSDGNKTIFGQNKGLTKGVLVTTGVILVSFGILGFVLEFFKKPVGKIIPDEENISINKKRLKELNTEYDKSYIIMLDKLKQENDEIGLRNSEIRLRNFEISEQNKRNLFRIDYSN